MTLKSFKFGLTTLFYNKCYTISGADEYCSDKLSYNSHCEHRSKVCLQYTYLESGQTSEIKYKEKFLFDDPNKHMGYIPNLIKFKQTSCIGVDEWTKLNFKSGENNLGLSCFKIESLNINSNFAVEH